VSLVGFILGGIIKKIMLCVSLIGFFCTTTFDAKFPLASARALSRSGSDHTPLIWYSGEAKVPKKGSSKF
jgi:hypothetical protein